MRPVSGFHPTQSTHGARIKANTPAGTRPVSVRVSDERFNALRRAQATSIGNEYSRKNAAELVKQKEANNQPVSPGLKRLAEKRASAQTVAMRPNELKFSQQTVTSHTKVSADAKSHHNVMDEMADSMAAHGYDKRKGGTMTATLAQHPVAGGVAVSHDNRRLATAKAAQLRNPDITLPMKLEHPNIQNIDPKAPERSANRPNNTVNDFLLNRTKPSLKGDVDPAHAAMGFSTGYDTVTAKQTFSYEGTQPSKNTKKQIKDQSQQELLKNQPFVSNIYGQNPKPNRA